MESRKEILDQINSSESCRHFQLEVLLDIRELLIELTKTTR